MLSTQLHLPVRLLPAQFVPAQVRAPSSRRGNHLLVAVLLTLVFPTLAAGQSTALTSPIPKLTQQDLADGERLFRVHCARCHGMLGAGGEGPSLKRPTLKHAPNDQALFDVISEGIQGTGMPGTWAPSDMEIWHIAGHVRALGRLPDEVAPGNADNGRILFTGSGACATCHITNGKGHGVGPELTNVGLRRNAAYLRRSLTNPDADSPMLSNQITGRIDGFLTVRVVAEHGEYEGLRISEDEFSIQLRDLSGTIHSFDKRRLLDYQKAFGHSLMPGYKTVFTESETDDLVSFLMSLKGET